MYKEVIKRLLSAIFTLFFASIVIFVLIRLAPGDPVKIMLGHPSELSVSDNSVYEQSVTKIREELGLNDSVIKQYLKWISRLFKLNLGISIFSGQDVGKEILQKLPATVCLAVVSVLLQTFIGIIFGILSAIFSGRFLDNAIRILCVMLASVPAFVMGLVLLYYCAVKSSLFQISTAATLNRLWLPAITLGIIGIPQIVRLVRANMLAEFGKTYVVSALSRGLPKINIVKHAMKNAFLPIVTVIAHSFATLMGGAVVIESIYSWPGIGNYAMNSVLNHDYPVIQGYAIIIVAIVILINMVADVFPILLDPQLRCKGVASHEKQT